MTFAPPMVQFETVLPLAELPRGSMRARVIGGREILLCHTRAGVFALDNICTHAHARLCEGRLRGTRLVCPLHGAAFDVRDGRVLASPAVLPLPTHAVRILEGAIEVACAPPAAQACAARVLRESSHTATSVTDAPTRNGAGGPASA